MHLTSIRFSNYRGLEDYSLALDDFNILVGPNNCGKSTIVSALRLLAAATHHARSRRPVRIKVGERERAGYWLNEATLPISLDNVHTELLPVVSEVEFRFGLGRTLTLHFPADGGCALLLDPNAPVVDSATAFRRHYPFRVFVLPVLGGLEDTEVLLKKESVRQAVGTPRASRHFRNYWWHFPDGFDEFAGFLKATWPDVTGIAAPVMPEPIPPRLVMFCTEDGRAREIQWAGFGFQVWCQMLTSLLQARGSDLVVIDEPEIYLHADLQRRLVHVLRELNADIIVASHSAEIITEVEATDIVVIDKRKTASKRTASPKRVQIALNSVGSNLNVYLSNLVRTRHVLFVEGEDFKVLRRWARLIGLDQLAAGIGLVTFRYGGFPTPEGVREICRGINAMAGDDEALVFAGIFDRDYRTEEAVEAIEEQLGRTLKLVHILYQKEVENYLLQVPVLTRAIESEVQRRNQRGSDIVWDRDVAELLADLTDEFRGEVESLYVQQRSQDRASAAETDLLAEFSTRWSQLPVRLGLVPGKRVLGRVIEYCQDEYGFSMSKTTVLNAFRQQDLPFEVASFLRELDAFRLQAPQRTRT